jgi:hypothetical protein
MYVLRSGMLVTSCIYISSSKDKNRTQFAVLREKKRIWTSTNFPTNDRNSPLLTSVQISCFGYHTDAQTEKKDFPFSPTDFTTTAAATTSTTNNNKVFVATEFNSIVSGRQPRQGVEDLQPF